MSRRDILTLTAGACIGLAVAAMLLPNASGIDARAQPPHETASEGQRQMMLAIANAVASVAVDGERTAVTLNQTIDQVAELDARVKHLEKRLADLETRR